MLFLSAGTRTLLKYRAAGVATPRRINPFCFGFHPHLLSPSLRRRFSAIPSRDTIMSNIPEKFGNFDLIKRVKLDFTDVVVSKWQSRITGLNVVHLDYEGGCPLTL